jgi:hypothetical protein
MMNRDKHTIKILPCGDELTVERGSNWRIYRLEKKDGDIEHLWSPHKVHRTALLEAIVAEDAFRYNEQTKE